MAKATVSRRVFRKCPGQVRATLRPNPLAMVSKKARGTCNLANKDGVSLSGYYSWAAPSRCFAGGVAGVRCSMELLRRGGGQWAGAWSVHSVSVAG